MPLLYPDNWQFWTAQELKAWNKVSPTMIDILFAGAVSGEQSLPKAAQVLVDWDLVNEDVINWLSGWRGGTFAKMNSHTMTRTVSAIQDWIKSGEHIDVLSAKLEPLYGKMRAKRIAVTEVTRAYAEGNQAAWKSTGLVSSKRWNTANDDLVCPICGPLDGMIVQIDSNGFTTEKGGLGLTSPPAHPNCRCWLTPVTTEDDLSRELAKILT